VETWDAIRARRNVRQYEDRPISREDLDRVLEAARRTPSAGNSQPWDFVAVTDRKGLEELAKVWPQGGAHVARSAATIALVGTAPESDERRDWTPYDLGQATMSIMLAAADLGIGTGHSAVSDHDLASRLLGLPADKRCFYLIALGYPADGPLKPLRNPKRRAFDDVVHRERW
jgi:nitroreductase